MKIKFGKVKSNQILRLVLLASFIAISIVLQVFATYIRIGEYSPALALVPIAISAILLGPVAGCITGGFWGLYILILIRLVLHFSNTAGLVLLLLY